MRPGMARAISRDAVLEARDAGKAPVERDGGLLARWRAPAAARVTQERLGAGRLGAPRPLEDFAGIVVPSV